MSDRAGGYTEYGFTAEFYDHVAPYRQRGDVAFFVEAAQAAGGPVLDLFNIPWRSLACLT
jgi:hypothetical protein